MGEGTRPSRPSAQGALHNAEHPKAPGEVPGQSITLAAKLGGKRGAEGGRGNGPGAGGQGPAAATEVSGRGRGQQRPGRVEVREGQGARKEGLKGGHGSGIRRRERPKGPLRTGRPRKGASPRAAGEGRGRRGPQANLDGRMRGKPKVAPQGDRANEERSGRVSVNAVNAPAPIGGGA